MIYKIIYLISQYYDPFTSVLKFHVLLKKMKQWVLYIKIIIKWTLFSDKN